METNRIVQVLKGANVILSDGHFVYTSGRHGDTYVNKDALYAHPVQTELVTRLIADEFFESKIDAVVGAAIGGVVLAQWVAWHLTRITGREILATYVEHKPEGGLVMKRGYDVLIKNKSVLIVEDVLNSGKTAQAVIDAITTPNINAQIAGLGVIFNRGNLLPSDFKVVGTIPRLYSLVNMPLQSWAPEVCPLCAQGIAVNVNVGKGNVFN